MTSVPPEPPEGSEQPYAPPPTPPPPAGQQWSTPSPRPASGGFNAAAVNPLDWGILAAGLLTFIFSFVDYTYSVGGVSVSDNAWHGFFGWFAMLLTLAVAVLLAVHLFAPHVQLPVPVRTTVLGGFALATLFVVIAGFVDSRSVPSGFGIESSRSAGYYLSLIVILAGTVLAYLRLRQSGGKLPWDNAGS